MSQTQPADLETMLHDNEEYRRLKTEHADYEKRLDDLLDKPALSLEEEREMVEIKKKKLRLKDRMAEISTSLRAS